MACSIRRIAVAAVLSFGFVLPAGADEHASHSAAAGLQLDQGKKWPTDAPLRAGMANMRTALAADLRAIHADAASDAQYEALAAKLNEEVAYVVAKCKLEPAADAQLHKVIAEILAGAEVMRGKAAGASRRSGAVRVAQVLNAYGEFFDHPRWRDL